MSPTPGRLARPVLLLVLAVATGWVLTSCWTTFDVAVEFDENGSGTVEVTAVLDAEAAAAIGGVEGLALDDVRQSGWDLSAPVVGDDASLTVTAEHGFVDAEELAAVLGQVAGTGVFTDVSGEFEDGFARTDREAGYTVAVIGDLAGLGDDDLTALLGGLPLGRTPEELVAQGALEPGAGALTVSVVVPGGDVDRAGVDLTGGVTQQASVSSQSSEVRWLPIALGAAGLLLVALAVAFGLVAAVRAIRR